MTDEKDINKLPFDENGQMAVIAWMLKNKEFAIKCKNHIKDDMFVSTILGEIFNTVVKFMVEYKDLPSKDNLITCFNIKKPDEFNKYKQVINDCLAMSMNYNLFYLQKGITVWLKLSIFRDYSLKIPKAYRASDTSTIQNMMKDALTKLSEANFEKQLNYEFKVEDPLDALRRAVDNGKNNITTGVPIFDAALGGGLARGESTVVIAPISTGKSTFCVNMLYHNMKVCQMKSLLN